MEKSVRLGDAQYLHFDRYENPLEMFKVIANMMHRYTSSNARILDVGCATGELLYFLRKQFPQASIEGIDVLDDLIEKANRVLGTPMARNGSVLNPKAAPPASFDVVLFLNTHMIFDDITEPFSNVVHWTKSGGVAYIAGAFNPDPVDVFVRHRHHGSEIMEHGWNMVSQETARKVLSKLVGAENVSVHPFELPFAVPRDPGDYLRQRTIETKDGRFVLSNGLSLLVQPCIFEVRKP